MPLVLSRNLLPAALVMGGCVIFLSLIGMVIFQQGQAARQMLALIGDTQAVLSDVNELNILLRDAERGQRGYLLTGQQDYLDPYELALKRLPVLRERFQQRVATHQSGHQQVELLWPLIDRKLDELARTIKLRTDAGEEPARQVVLSDVGHDLMIQITKVLDAVSVEENRDLAERNGAMERTEASMYKLAAGGSGVAVVLLALALLTLRQTEARHRGIERQKEDQQHELDRTNATLREMKEQSAAAQYAHSLLEANRDPLVTISPLGRITDVNEATIDITGVPRENLLGTDFRDYFTDPERASEGYRRVFAEGSVIDLPLAIRHSRKAPTEVMLNASVYKDSAGNLLGVIAGARDMTAQRKAERQSAAQRGMELDRLAELEHFQTITVGRELKMIELKKQILELKG